MEIVNPDTLEPVPEGEIGELVLTTINREAMPLLRYRTRDLTRILPGDCPCGRHHIRLDRMKGRSDDMMILKGVNIFPIQIENILMQFKELGNDYLITLTNLEANDEMTVEVELNDFTDDYGFLQRLTKEITRQLKDEILITPRVKLVPKGSISDTVEYGIYRIICSEPMRAYDTLKQAGISANLSEVFAIMLDNQPGRAADAIRSFSEAEICISYLYSFLLSGKGILVFRTDDAEKTRQVILNKKLDYIEEKRLLEMA